MPELLSPPIPGARGDAGTGTFRGGSPRGGRPSPAARPIRPLAFAGVAVASFGGPLALAALSAPGIVGDAADSAGFTMIAAAVVFVMPLAIWLRYSRQIASAGGLYAFVEAAAGRRVALAQAAVWIFSYVLYLAYTTVQIVYDVLPNVVPGVRSYQTALALLIPVAIAAVMIAGRAAALIAIGVIALGQVALAGLLDGITLTHLQTPVSSFGTGAPTHALTSASAQTSLLYICGSLPLFLGGELSRPSRTIRRGLSGAFVLTAAVVTLAVAPLAASPGLLRTEVPGVSVAEQFSTAGVAHAIGIGVAVSIAGVMLCEYLALTRLVHAVSGRRLRSIAIALGAVLVLAGPISLIDPSGFYDTLLKPSLAALWISQLIVFLVYPRFAVRHGGRAVIAWPLAAAASAFAAYGLWMVFQQAST